MNEITKSQYDTYLTRHINGVKTAFNWLLIKIPEIFEGYDAEYIGTHFIRNHDDSKYSEEEYEAYCDYFYDKRTDDVKQAFNLAWLHHQNNNPHHWQYWLLQKDDGTVDPMPMDYENIIEMICDWWSFSWVSDNLLEIFNWYEKNESDMILNPETECTVKHILNLIKTKLEDENYGNKE